MDLKKTKINIDIKNWSKRCFGCILKGSEVILFFVFLVCVAFCFYLLYRYIYRPEWSEFKKTEYVNSREKAAVFNEEKFKAAVDGEAERVGRYEKKIENIPDVFGLE